VDAEDFGAAFDRSSGHCGFQGRKCSTRQLAYSARRKGIYHGFNNAMIRDAQYADLDRIVEMGRRFRKDTSYDKHLTDNPQKMTELAEKLISNQTLLVSELNGELVGMLGFVVYPHFISGETMAGEIFWWQEPEHRGEGIRLLREMEKRARLAGAKNMQMIAPNQKVAHFYERMGYEFVEQTYQRAL
jgi:RimJ/RimL family protein N-acetyltransferase